MNSIKKIKLSKNEVINLPPLDLKTEIKLRAFTNLLIDRVIEDRKNGYYIYRKGARRKRRISAK